MMGRGYSHERYRRDKVRRTTLHNSGRILSSLAGVAHTELAPEERDPVTRQREKLAIRLIRCCMALPEYGELADEDLYYDWDVLERMAEMKYDEIARTVEISDGIGLPVADDLRPYLLEYIRTKRDEDFQ